MSWWSYIDGVVNVSVPGKTQPQIRYILETVLDHLPVVTGSEGDMYVYPIKQEHHSCSSSHDEFGFRTNNLTDEYGFRSRKGGWLQTQTNYILVVHGALRDRMFGRTFREFTKWLTRLSKRLYVEDILVRVSDSLHEYKFDDPSRFEDMYEHASWCQDEDKPPEPAWWEFMMWEQDPASDMPLAHALKYYKDPRLGAELKRRRKWAEKVSEGLDGE